MTDKQLIEELETSRRCSYRLHRPSEAMAGHSHWTTSRRRALFLTTAQSGSSGTRLPAVMRRLQAVVSAAACWPVRTLAAPCAAVILCGHRDGPRARAKREGDSREAGHRAQRSAESEAGA